MCVQVDGEVAYFFKQEKGIFLSMRIIYKALCHLLKAELQWVFFTDKLKDLSY